MANDSSMIPVANESAADPDFVAGAGLASATPSSTMRGALEAMHSVDLGHPNIVQTFKSTQRAVAVCILFHFCCASIAHSCPLQLSLLHTLILPEQVYTEAPAVESSGSGRGLIGALAVSSFSQLSRALDMGPGIVQIGPA